MIAHAPHVAESFDAVIAAAQNAPLVPLSDEERALLDEVEKGPVRWLSHEEFASQLPSEGAR